MLRPPPSRGYLTGLLVPKEDSDEADPTADGRCATEAAVRRLTACMLGAEFPTTYRTSCGASTTTLRRLEPVGQVSMWPASR